MCDIHDSELLLGPPPSLSSPLCRLSDDLDSCCVSIPCRQLQIARMSTEGTMAIVCRTPIYCVRPCLTAMKWSQRPAPFGVSRNVQICAPRPNRLGLCRRLGLPCLEPSKQLHNHAFPQTCSGILAFAFECFIHAAGDPASGISRAVNAS